MLDLVKTIAVSAAVPALLAAGAVTFGGPSDPPPLTAIGAAFDAVDYADMPPLSRFEARDGESLAYRRYDGAGDRLVIALHGSAGSSTSLHPLARAVSGAHSGPTVVALDIRGHGASGRRGDVDYIGQASDDVDDFVEHLRSTAPDAEISVLGFSMGGGLALKFAARRSDIAQVLLLAPYLAHDAAPMTAENPNAPEVKWATAGVGRIIGLSMLNFVGVTALNGLTTVRLAIRAEDREGLADRYSYRLMNSVNPTDWRSDLAAVADRLILIGGERDGLHLASAYREVLAETAPGARFIEAADVDHMGLTLDPAALALITEVMGGA